MCHDSIMSKWKPSPLSRVIAQNIVGLRDEREWSQSDLAERLQRAGISWSRTMISAIENGERNCTRLEILIVMSKIFGVPIRRFFFEGRSDTQVQVTRDLTMQIDELQSLIFGEFK